MNFYSILIFSAVAVLPFFPKQLDPFIAYGIAGLSLLLFPVFLKNLKQNLREKNIPVIFFLIFLLSALISTVFSINKELSIVRLILFAGFFIIFISVKPLFKDFKMKQGFAVLLVAVTFFLSLISLYHTFILNYVNWEPFGVSFMWTYYGHNHLSSLLIFSIPLGFYLIRNYCSSLLRTISIKTSRLPRQLAGRSKNIVIIVVLLFIQSVLLFSFIFTFARASLISLLTASFISVFLFTDLKKHRAHILIFTVISTIVIFAGSLTMNNSGQFNVGKYETAITSRVVYWKQVFDNFLKYPFFGSGLNTFTFQTKSFRTISAHNFFLQMLSDAGIFGFLASISLIFSVLWKSFRIVREKTEGNEKYLFIAFWVGMLASTFNTFADFDWQIPTVFWIFWLIAGII